MTVYIRDDAYILHLKSGIHLSARKDTSKDSHSDCSVRQNSKMHSRYKGFFFKKKRGSFIRVEVSNESPGKAVFNSEWCKSNSFVGGILPVL